MSEHIRAGNHRALQRARRTSDRITETKRQRFLDTLAATCNVCMRDPFDWRSGEGSAVDQQLGIGDGATTRFALVKHYGAHVRRITRPVAGSVRIAVDGVETVDFTIEEGGWITLDAPPDEGAVVTGGFDFDVPVRFAEDRLGVTAATFLAGAAPSVPLVELREG